MTALPSENPLKVALANAASEPRTLEELRRAMTEIDEKLRDYNNYTGRQLRQFSRERNGLSKAIMDKKMAYGLTNGRVHIVPEFRQGEWKISVSLDSGRRKNRREMQRAKAWVSRTYKDDPQVLKAYERFACTIPAKVWNDASILNVNLTTDVVCVRSEDQKTQTCRVGCTE
jgi:hypothetical protein